MAYRTLWTAKALVKSIQSTYHKNNGASVCVSRGFLLNQASCRMFLEGKQVYKSNTWATCKVPREGENVRSYGMSTNTDKAGRKSTDVMGGRKEKWMLSGAIAALIKRCAQKMRGSGVKKSAGRLGGAMNFEPNHSNKIRGKLNEGILLGCGNPLLDISACVDDALLQKYGLKPDDAILAEEKHKPLYSELMEKYKAEYIAGGSVQNSLRVCQWMLQKPNCAVFFGCVGDDKYSKILEDKARSDGVNVQYQYNQEQPTGTCGVLITGTHRSLCANLAAANLFTIDHIEKPENKKILQGAEYFYISGFFLTVSPPSIMEVARHSHNHNRTFMMNLSAPFITQFFKDPLMKALPYVDLLFGNETEAETFAQEQGWETKDMKEIGKLLVQLPKENVQRPRIVIITQGSKPVLLFRDEETIEEFLIEPLPREEIVDTNGAGDAFVGGFLSQYIQKKQLETCIKAGIFAARTIIKRSGCTFEGKPDFEA